MFSTQAHISFHSTSTCKDPGRHETGTRRQRERQSRRQGEEACALIHDHLNNQKPKNTKRVDPYEQKTPSNRSKNPASPLACMPSLINKSQKSLRLTRLDSLDRRPPTDKGEKTPHKEARTRARGQEAKKVVISDRWMGVVGCGRNNTVVSRSQISLRLRRPADPSEATCAADEEAQVARLSEIPAAFWKKRERVFVRCPCPCRLGCWV